ncbi:MAG: endonuclease III [Bacteroidetes bacterium]|nr:endonuclease III [Bacteroidota bacterium]
MAVKKSAKILSDAVSNEINDWNKALKPLFKKYKGKKHPLEYKNLYQLVIMVILSARDSDRHINQIAPALFKKFSSVKKLSTASPEELHPYIKGVLNYARKAEWISAFAKEVKSDKNIPLTIETLTQFKGIGRKTANVIMTEMGVPLEGVIVDLHTLRVAPRIGIAKGTNPENIEKQLMEKVQQKNWGILGLSLSHLGRETCRPTNPKCHECVVNTICEYYRLLK